jgi:hypothetical protein
LILLFGFDFSDLKRLCSNLVSTILQRVPVTEKSGRVHTSAASVAVLPQADEVMMEDSFSVFQ